MASVTVLGGRDAGTKRRAERLSGRVEEARSLLASLDPKALSRLTAELPSGGNAAAARILRHREEALRILSRLDQATCAEICRHDEETAEIDGYPTRSPGSGIGGAGGGPTISVPVGGGVTDTVPLTSTTEAAVFARVTGHRPDPVGNAVRWIEVGVVLVTRLLAGLARDVPEIFRPIAEEEPTTERAQRVTTSVEAPPKPLRPPCAACGARPRSRLVDGLCSGCRHDLNQVERRDLMEQMRRNA